MAYFGSFCKSFPHLPSATFWSCKSLGFPSPFKVTVSSSLSTMSFTATNKRRREEFQYGQFTAFSSFSGRKEKRQQFSPGKNHIDESTAKVLRSFHSSSSAPSATFHVEVEADTDTPKISKSVGGHWRPKRTLKDVVSNPNILKVTCSSYNSLLSNIHSYKLSGLVAEAAIVLEKRTQEYEEHFKDHKLEVEEFSVLEAYVGLAWEEYSDQISQKKHLEIDTPRLLATKNASYVKLNGEKEKYIQLEQDLSSTENLISTSLSKKRVHLNDFEAMRGQLTAIFEGQEEQVDEIRLCLTPRERRSAEEAPETPSEPPTKNTALLSRIQAYESERSDLFVTDTESETESISVAAIFQLKSNSLNSDLQTIRLFELENSQKIKLAQIKKEQALLTALIKEKKGHEKLLALYSAERLADSPMSKLSDEEKSFQKFVSLKKDIRHLRYGLAFMRFFKHAAQDSKRTFIGPLGSYLKLKPETSKRQKHMVTWFLSKFLKTFIVFTLSDKLYFERKNKEYGSDVDVVLHKVTPREAPDQRVSPTDTIKSFLDIDDPVVLDYLESQKRIHLIGVSHLRYQPSSQVFLNSQNQPHHADHIKGSTLICSEDMRVVEVTTVIPESEFEQKAEFPDPTTEYRYLEATLDTSHVLQEWKEHIRLFGQLVEGQLRVCKDLGPSHLARKDLCEATQKRTKLTAYISKLAELQGQCQTLRERLVDDERELSRHRAAQKDLVEKGKALSQSLQAAEANFSEADRKHQAASQELTALRNNAGLSKAIEENAERRKIIHEYALKYPGSNLRRKAKGNTVRSIAAAKVKLDTREEELEREKEYLEGRSKLEGKEYYEANITWGYLSKLGVDVDPEKKFDKTLAKRATVVALSQLDCPTVFVNGDIDVPGKQVMVVKKK